MFSPPSAFNVTIRLLFFRVGQPIKTPPPPPPPPPSGLKILFQLNIYIIIFRIEKAWRFLLLGPPGSIHFLFIVCRPEKKEVFIRKWRTVIGAIGASFEWTPPPLCLLLQPSQSPRRWETSLELRGDKKQNKKKNFFIFKFVNGVLCVLQTSLNRQRPRFRRCLPLLRHRPRLRWITTAEGFY